MNEESWNSGKKIVTQWFVNMTEKKNEVEQRKGERTKPEEVEKKTRVEIKI